VPSASFNCSSAARVLGSTLRGGGGTKGGLAANQRLGFAHRQPARHDLSRDSPLSDLVSRREERPGVAHRQGRGREIVPDLGRQAQQPDVVGDGRAILADSSTDLLL
jgi:hypothetical protein